MRGPTHLSGFPPITGRGTAVSSWSESRPVTKATWGVVRANPYLLLFPVVAAVVGIAVVLAVVGVALGLFGVEAATQQAEQATSGGEVPTSTAIIGVIVMVIAAYLGTLITDICMGGLVAAADAELQGRDSSFGAGIAQAFRRLPALLGWAGIQTAVGWLLSAIRGDGTSNNAIVAIIRAIAASLVAMAWSVVSFFVLPLIILRGEGPVGALKRSFALVKSTWGTQVSGRVRIGAMIALLGTLPGILVLVGGGFLTAASNLAVGVPLIILGIVVLMVASILVSALKAVFSVALLHFAETQQPIGPFSAEQLQSAVKVSGHR
ncbi:MAG: hypothetical protein QG597_1476 [Actinomycetota bacterium]|nr:hypothetical protein [Actinomycetota bacterium]